MRVSIGLLLVAVTGCGTDGGPVAGDPPGGTFDIAEMISATVTFNDGGDTSSEAQIVLSSTSGACTDASASPPVDRKAGRIILIELRDVNGATKSEPMTPGTYTIYPNTGSEPPKSASLTISGFDSSCQSDDSVAASAQSGTVSLTSVAAGVYTGSFTVGLNTGGTLGGSFAPTACPQLATAATSTQPHTCR